MIARVGREPGEGELGMLARRNYEAGKLVSGADAFAAAQRVRALCWQILEQFHDLDVFVTPVLGTPPPLTDELDPVSGDLKTFDRRTAGGP